MNASDRLAGSRRLAALSLLAVTCFAGGITLGAVGCHAARQTGPEQEPAGDGVPGRASAVTQPTALERKAAPELVRVAASDVAAATPVTAATAVSAGSKSVAPEATSLAPLRVRRLLVTAAVENREPAGSDGLVAGNSPIYAFVELENAAAMSRDIVVTFERQGRDPVGHIRLNVPGSNSRWRTWGHTRRIHEAGTWTAVVRTADGRELARTTFEVAGAGA